MNKKKIPAGKKGKGLRALDNGKTWFIRKYSCET